MIPEVRREPPEMIVGRSHSYYKRWVRPRLKQMGAHLLCWFFGHIWSPWKLDDYEGPGEELEEGGFMPFCSRDSRPGEYGERLCQRGCGTSEQRYPLFEAPVLWIEKLMAEEAK